MQLKSLALAVPILLGLSAAQAHASTLIITPTYDSSWSADPNAAADQAAINSLITNVYESRYTNPINVAIDFTVVNTGLGSSLTGYYSDTYDTYRNALIADKQIINGGDGNTAFLSNLPNTGNPVPGNSTVGVSYSSAQGRVLGFDTPGTIIVGAGTFDSNIKLNVGAFPTNDASAALVATAAHEINEALGLSSALNGLTDSAGTATVADVGSLDFFRYAAIGDNTTVNPTPTSNRSFTSSSAAVSYFSDTGGSNPIVFFNQSDSGDRHDWASNGEAFDGLVQVQDAFGPADATPQMGPAEFQALNDIGYNTAAVPEASQFTGLSIGLLVLSIAGLWRGRRQRSQKTGA